MKNTVIFDLDGTLVNIDVRRDKSLKPNGKLDWDIFASPTSVMDWDTPNKPVVKMYNCFTMMVLELLSLVVGMIGRFTYTRLVENTQCTI